MFLVKLTPVIPHRQDTTCRLAASVTQAGPVRHLQMDPLDPSIHRLSQGTPGHQVTLLVPARL